jgi:hypothetical protein
MLSQVAVQRGESPFTFMAAGTGSALQKRTCTQGMAGLLTVVLGWQQLSPFKPLACQLLLLILVVTMTAMDAVATWMATWSP